MPPAWFEPGIPVSERPQTHVLDLTATGTSTEALRDSQLLKISVLGTIKHAVG